MSHQLWGATLDVCQGLRGLRRDGELDVVLGRTGGLEGHPRERALLGAALDARDGLPDPRGREARLLTLNKNASGEVSEEAMITNDNHDSACLAHWKVVKSGAYSHPVAIGQARSSCIGPCCESHAHRWSPKKTSVQQKGLNDAAQVLCRRNK